MKNKILAVLVTYNPQTDLLMQTLSVLSKQVEKVVIVDNASSIKIQLTAEFDYVNILELQDNYGLGYAQNIGIEYAIDSAMDYVLLLDQDTVPYSSIIDKLVGGFSHPDVIAVGSSYWDSRNQVRSFFVVEENAKPRKWRPLLNESYPLYIEVAALIASGTLIKLSLLQLVGGKRSGYFIDRVDTEWSFRARAGGFKLLGVTEPIMEHAIGDKVKKIWCFGWRNVPYHNPLRDYYAFRNTLLLIQDVKLSWRWRIHLLWLLVLFAGYFLIFVNHRFNRLSLMLKGLHHGMQDKRGKLDVASGALIDVGFTSIDP